MCAKSCTRQTLWSLRHMLSFGWSLTTESEIVLGCLRRLRDRPSPSGRRLPWRRNGRVVMRLPYCRRSLAHQRTRLRRPILAPHHAQTASSLEVMLKRQCGHSSSREENLRAMEFHSHAVTVVPFEMGGPDPRTAEGLVRT